MLRVRPSRESCCPRSSGLARQPTHQLTVPTPRLLDSARLCGSHGPYARIDRNVLRQAFQGTLPGHPKAPAVRAKRCVPRRLAHGFDVVEIIWHVWLGDHEPLVGLRLVGLPQDRCSMLQRVFATTPSSRIPAFTSLAFRVSYGTLAQATARNEGGTRSRPASGPDSERSLGGAIQIGARFDSTTTRRGRRRRSPLEGGLDRRDVDLLHRHHRVHRALRGCRVRIVQSLRAARGVICHENPHLSLHQPQSLSCPPLSTIAFQ